MTLIDKTDDEIRKEIIDLAGKELGFKNFKSTGVLRSIWEVFSKTISQIYHKFLTPIYHNTNLDTATGPWLDQWGLLLGVVRKLATKTQGIVTLIAYNDGTLEKGSWITVSGTGLRFKVVESVPFAKGENQVLIEAEFSGSEYNVSGEDEGILTKVVSGVESVFFREGWITEAGTDDEKDDVYRKRIKDLWMSQGIGNPPPSFYYYAESVPGVQQVKLIRTPRGYGTVDIIVVAENGMPSKELLDKVYKALEDHALICNDLQVKAPGEKAVSVSVEFKGDATENEIEEAVMQHIFKLGVGGRLEVRNIYETLDKFDLDVVEVILPERDVQADDDSIIVATVEAKKQ